CVDESFGLDIDGCAILQLGGGKVSITGSSPGVAGDVCVGPGGSLSISTTGVGIVHGACRLNGSFSGDAAKCSGGVQTGQDLTSFISDCRNAAADLSTKPCDQNFDKLRGPITISAKKDGENVICVTTDVTSSGGNINFSTNGHSNVTFVVDI